MGAGTSFNSCLANGLGEDDYIFSAEKLGARSSSEAWRSPSPQRTLPQPEAEEDLGRHQDQKALEALAGRWIGGAGGLHTIENHAVHWGDGNVSKLRTFTVTGVPNCYTTVHGFTYRGELKGGKIHWSDGDIWIRDAKPGEEAPRSCSLSRTAGCIFSGIIQAPISVISWTVSSTSAALSSATDLAVSSASPALPAPPGGTPSIQGHQGSSSTRMASSYHGGHPGGFDSPPRHREAFAPHDLGRPSPSAPSARSPPAEAMSRAPASWLDDFPTLSPPGSGPAVPQTMPPATAAGVDWRDVGVRGRAEAYQQQPPPARGAAGAHRHEDEEYASSISPTRSPAHWSSSTGTKPDFSGRWLCSDTDGDVEGFLEALGGKRFNRFTALAQGYGVGGAARVITQAGSELCIALEGFNASEMRLKIGGEENEVDTPQGTVWVQAVWEGSSLLCKYRDDSGYARPSQRYFLDEDQLVLEAFGWPGSKTAKFILQRA